MMDERSVLLEQDKAYDKVCAYYDTHCCAICYDFKHNDEIEGFNGYCAHYLQPCNSTDHFTECWED